MGFRFWKRIKIAPGVTVNLSKSGASLSFGPRGAKFTVGPKGSRVTVGIPGTGIYYTTTVSSRKARKEEEAIEPYSAPSVPTVRPEERLSLSFFKRLITPKDEEALVDGCRELVLGNEEKALEHLKNAVHLADGAYLAGFLALKYDQLDDAATYLETAAEKHGSLGQYFAKYGISATMTISITDEISAHVGPDLRGVLLGLVEVYQRQKRWKDAIACLGKLHEIEPYDMVVKLSLVELLFSVSPGNTEILRRIVRLTEGIENKTPIRSAILLYRARALRRLGLLEKARETLTEALRQKKDRSDELIRALRYERALVYDGLGQDKRARGELEKLYAEDPNYEDVAARLGR